MGVTTGCSGSASNFDALHGGGCGPFGQPDLDASGALGMNWRSKRLSSSNSAVPAAAGVYVIGHSDTLHDLEISRTYVYVGETTNLQRRLNEHLPANEKNPGLREYIGSNYDDAICWYTRVAAAETKAIQDELILRLRPRFNTVGNQPVDHEEQT